MTVGTRHPLRAQLLAAATSASAQSPKAAPLHVPNDHCILRNGLNVPLSRDTTGPTAVAAVYYNIDFRNDKATVAPIWQRMIGWCRKR